MSLAQSAKQVDKSKIWRTGLIAVAASLVANLMAYFLLNAILDLPSPADFPPLSPAAIGFITALFTFIGVAVFALLTRNTANPVRVFWIVATVAFIVSIIPNIISALNPAAAPFPFPVSSATGFWVLIIFHLIAYLITTFVMTTQTLTD